MTAIVIVLQALTVFFLGYTIVCSRASTWYCQQATLWHTDPDAARVRKQSPPRSVRMHAAVQRLVESVRA